MAVCLLLESGPVGPSKAPTNINERARARVCVCVSLSTGFVPLVIMIKPVESWSGGDLADWRIGGCKALARRFCGRLPGMIMIIQFMARCCMVTCWYQGQPFSLLWWLAVIKPGICMTSSLIYQRSDLSQIGNKRRLFREAQRHAQPLVLLLICVCNLLISTSRTVVSTFFSLGLFFGSLVFPSIKKGLSR